MTAEADDPDAPESPGYPDNFEFRLAPNRRLFAIWDPGNGPWFVTDAAGHGEWLQPSVMDALGWTRYLPAPASPSPA